MKKSVHSASTDRRFSPIVSSIGFSRMLNWIALASGVLFAGCAQPAGPSPDLPNPERTDTPESESFVRTPLPGVSNPTVGLLQPGPPPPRPDLCDWADSVDAIVFGTLKSFEVTMTPWAGQSATSVVHDQPCSENSQGPSIRIVLDVEESMKGPLMGEVVVWAPNMRRPHLSPSVSMDEDGSTVWHDLAGTLVSAPVQVGQKLGLALHYVGPYDAYTAMFEPFFGVDEAGAPLFQPGDEAEPYQFYRAPDISVDVAKLSDVKASIAANCGKELSAIGAERRASMRSGGAADLDINDASPAYSFAAWCQHWDSLEDDTD